MLSLTTPTQIPTSNHHVSRLTSRLIPALFFACKSKKRDKILGFGLMEEIREYKFGRGIESSWCLRCQQSDGDVDLEAEILGFMANSDKPTMFPTKDELVRAGRFDLVKSIEKKGGWYSFGWEDENVGGDVEETTDSDIAEFQRRIQSCKQSSSSFSRGVINSTSSSFSGVINSASRNLDTQQTSLDTPSQLAADEDSVDLAVDEDSGKIAVDKDSGIDGILSRLKKQRNNDLMGIELGKDKYGARSRGKDEEDGRHSNPSLGFGRIDLEGNGGLSSAYHDNGTLDSVDRNIRHYTEPETWRSWSNRRAGSQHTEFEAAEISFGENSVDVDTDSHHDGVTVTTEDGSDKHEEINYNEIRSRLRYLQAELTTALQSVRSKKVDSIPEEVTESSSELHNLSDALEFQENEVMKAKEQLRSLRAKLAILEGKMTLAAVNAERIVEMKHKRIDDARKSLQYLRSTSIVWHNSAREVFLAGSFDGWTSQRRMQKSESGVFSITLKLYPGRYEIKFIVDGEWRVDPLRPIVNNNGHQNNLFTVI